MKNLKRLIPVVIVTTSLITSCSKLEKPETTPKSNFDNVALNNTNDFGKELVIMDGGNKGECDDPGASCANKRLALQPSEVEFELKQLQAFIDNNNAKEYFSTSGWRILFPELDDSEVAEIINETLFLYQMNDNKDPDGHIYVISSSNTRAGLSTGNTLGAWAY